MNTKPFSERSASDIYLEYVNEWLTVEAMAENYGRDKETMLSLIIKGWHEHEIKIRYNENNN